MNRPETTRRTTRFKELLHRAELDFLCEAHNGVSARIAEEAGFQALWAGGLCMSAQFGVRDSNEASWTQVLEMLEFMADATTVPILLDGDTGYGNFNNVRRLVRKLEQRSVAAVCIEDKLYPKTNSFINGSQQELAEIDEFCGRIKAGKDAQQDDDFSIIARVEALIAGWGLDEALRRAEAYHEAGADAILIHSASDQPDEVLEFKAEWGDRCPVVIVPTKYYTTPTDVFRESGFSMAIWANHLLRASIGAMRECAGDLFREQNLISTESKVVPVEEIFRLQGASELQDAEDRYLPQQDPEASAIVVDGGAGNFGVVAPTLEISGKHWLRHLTEVYNSVGIRQICAAGSDRIVSGELRALDGALAEVPVTSDLYISSGSVVFKPFIIKSLAEHDEDVVIAVETAWQDYYELGQAANYVNCSEPHSRRSYDRRVELVVTGEHLPSELIHGEWIGVMRVAARANLRLRRVVGELIANGGEQEISLLQLLAELVERGVGVRVVYTSGHWLNAGNLEDVEAAESFV